MVSRRTHHRKMVNRLMLLVLWWCSVHHQVSADLFRSSFSSLSSSSSALSSYPAHEYVTGGLANETVCSNVDIRNSVSQFRKLINCTVVEGFVQILLIDTASMKDFENLTFPLLREITDYLLLYRVQGLTSLAKLFPNLTAIKGQVLFHNYALVIYEMRSMHEVGLTSLTAISRGSVRIERNSHLCYVDTIDWDHIAKSGRGGHFIKDNVPNEQCPNACPANCAIGSLAGGKQLKLCWNSNKCQKICSSHCEHQNLTCTSDSECCHKECLGGCIGKRSSDCIACQHVTFNGMCMKKCPQGTFEYLGRRCIEENDCLKVKNQLSLQRSDPIYWKPFKGECLPHCPAGYMESTLNKHKCIACKDQCPKICVPHVVDSVASAQKLKGCTYIDGSLEIQIQGGDNVIKELEASLSSVKEIRGYLKIARSFPLISLNFLKDLTHIRGQILDKQDYALLVLDNQNLQELWDWKHRERKLVIGGGKIFFHFNSKLCPNKIEELKKYADVMDWDDRDVSPSSNGDRVACNMIKVPIETWKIDCEVAGLKWRDLRNHTDNFDFRSLLGYVVYYREAPDRNVTKFDGRDACGSDLWKMDDVEADTDGTSNEIYTILPQLKPYTTYAAYMRTYTIASASLGAETDIIYFTTKPFTPTPPVNIRAHSTGPGEVVVSWGKPKKPNGEITHYIIEGIREKDLKEFISRRNYCTGPMDFYKLRQKTLTEETVPKVSLWNPNGTASPEPEKCCSCTKPSGLESKETDAELQIDFEDFLHNAVYLKNPNPDIPKRARKKPTKNQTVLSSTVRPTVRPINLTRGTTTTTLRPPAPMTTEIPYINRTEVPPENDLDRFRQVIRNNMFLVISKLHHFTEYTIEVKACQEPHHEKCVDASECSTQAITIVRTLPLGGADDIPEDSIILNKDNVTYGNVFVKWDMPKDPNGLIVSYNIEHKLADAQEYKSAPACITQEEYSAKMGYSVHDLNPGNHSLRLRAISLAGNGNWTKPKYFVVPESREGIAHETLAILTVVAILLLICLSGLGVYIVRKKYGFQIPDGILYASVNPEYISAGLVYEPDEWEVAREKITILQELGQGSFGMVYKGELKGLNEPNVLLPCAIKTVNDSASMRERIEFLQEASVMKAFTCHHIVKLLGVVSKGHPTLVVMELMSKGDLKAFLRFRRPDQEGSVEEVPTYKDILQMAAEIADGMAYLSAKKFVHRDLAARNCMVAEDHTVKIGDFGMTRDIYETDYYRKGGKGLLPVRWMAPECLKDGVFSCQSDIWSYGVVLWEMATFASQPYQGLANEQVLNYVISGRIMERPENCPEMLYALMKLCWEFRPKARPTFTEIIEILMPGINEAKFSKVSFYFGQKQETSTKEIESANAATTSTPLRNCMLEMTSHGRDDSDDENDLQYLPAARGISDDNFVHNNLPSDSSLENFDGVRDGNAAAATATSGGDDSKGIHSNDGSKGMSINSSDGSKGSKVSNISNGSIANGHIGFTVGRTTTC